MKQKLFKKNLGFTLVETLVAIAILMIAIAGPLTIANKALTSALYARDQSIASYLAQESLEIIKNIKDNNVKNSTFLTSLPNVGSIADAGTDSGTYNIMSTCDPSGCPIFLDNDGNYSHADIGTRTIFSRYFYITQMNGSSGPDANDYQATVVVNWNEGLTPNELRLHSEIVNAVRQ